MPLTPARPTASSRRAILVEAFAAAAGVTGAVTALSMFAPEEYVASLVGAVFLGATWLLVWRRDDAHVVRAGLSFGGLVLPGRLDVGRIARAAAVALAWAVGCAAVVFVPFAFGFRWWWRPTAPFHLLPLPMTARELVTTAAGQWVIIALPEEAFYRGYLQSRFDDAWAGRTRVFGAEVGPGLVVSSAIFALGHIATIPVPSRLAVFFPSLLFGWLRARTRGIGASCTFHAMCNVFSEMLGRAYGLY